MPFWRTDQLDVRGTVVTVVVGPVEGGNDGSVGIGSRATERAAIVVVARRTTAVVADNGGGTVADVETAGAADEVTVASSGPMSVFPNPAGPSASNAHGRLVIARRHSEDSGLEEDGD